MHKACCCITKTRCGRELKPSARRPDSMHAADTQQTTSCQNIVYILLYVTIVYVTLMLYGCLDMIIAFV